MFLQVSSVLTTISIHFTFCLVMDKHCCQNRVLGCLHYLFGCGSLHRHIFLSAGFFKWTTKNYPNGSLFNNCFPCIFCALILHRFLSTSGAVSIAFQNFSLSLSTVDYNFLQNNASFQKRKQNVRTNAELDVVSKFLIKCCTNVFVFSVPQKYAERNFYMLRQYIIN